MQPQPAHGREPVLLRRGLGETALRGALAAAFAPSRLVVAASDELPADIIAPGGVGALVVHADTQLPLERAARLCKTFKHPVVAVEAAALNRTTIALGAELLELCTVLPCAHASHLAQALADFVATKDQIIGRDMEAETGRMEEELAAKLSEGAGVRVADAHALLCAVPLAEIVGAPFDRLVDLSPLLPRSTAAVHHWFGAGRADEGGAAI